MYIINRQENRISQIAATTFHSLGYSERAHLQEWIAENPQCLCTDENDDLLIIQKEFNGFSDTNERLDLLAIDKTGALVVIENKLDDTGHDVTWQALKYASYCSTLKAQQIKDIFQAYLSKVSPTTIAEDKIIEFFNGKPFDEIPLNMSDQRIILVAGKFRKEVTSTVMWLRDKHKLRIQCLRVMPYKLNDEEILDIEQIIPVKEAEDYMIKIADKEMENDEKQVKLLGTGDLRKSFWMSLLEKYNQIDSHFKNVNPTTDHWLSCGSGVSGCSFNLVVTTNYAAVELSIGNSDQAQNKRLFDILLQQKNEIERAFDGNLKWERLDDKKMSRISYQLLGVSIKEKNDWQKIIDFITNSMPRLILALQDPLKKSSHK